VSHRRSVSKPVSCADLPTITSCFWPANACRDVSGIQSSESETSEHKYLQSSPQGRTHCGGGGGLPGGSPTPANPQNCNLKNTDFVGIMISRVLRDCPFSKNQPLKSADDQYVRILKNILINLKIKRR
jgi:hypothetical protein